MNHKMAEHTVSVIVPIYNGKKYIPRLFKCLYTQTYQNNEVIFVDDGSPDDIGALISELSNEYQLECRLIKQSNTGQGGARNRGIGEATGEFLVFLDQDDYIRSDYIETLLKIATDGGCDIVISGYEHVSFLGDVKEHVELVNNEWCRFMNITPWGKMYRREFIVRNNIRFLPVALGEDIYFNILCYSHTDKITYTRYVGYQWVINEASVSNTVHRCVSDESDVLRLFDALTGMDSANVWIRDPQYEYFILKTGIFHLLYASKETPEGMLIDYRNRVFKWMDEHLPGWERNRYIRWNEPAGERATVRHIIYLYMLLRRVHMDGLLLRLLRFVPVKI